MNCSWGKLCGKALVWLAIEIMLNLTGMDNVADYSEFIFKGNRVNSFLSASVILERADANPSSL